MLAFCPLNLTLYCPYGTYKTHIKNWNDQHSMKPHLVIKTTVPVAAPTVYWEDALHSKRRVPDRFIPSVDQFLQKKYRLPYWLTYNFKPTTGEWSPEEVKAGFNRIYRLILRQNTQIPSDLINDLQVLPEVDYVRVGGVAHTDLPNQEISQSASLTRKYRPAHTYLSEAHLFSKGSGAIKIAVLDTGFDLSHPEIRHALLPGKDFVNIINGAKGFIGDYLGFDNTPEDEVGHGTHVAGIIVGKGKKMPIGVVPECKIIPVKVLGALKRGEKVVGAGLIDNINNGIKWAVDQGADVINMSLGIKHKGGGLPHEEVIRYALQKGVTVVAASGNDGMPDKYYPGALPGVIAVGAADDQGQVAPFSTYGGHVSVIAPGMNIYSSFLNGKYAVSSGTSQAAPFVSGAIALIKSFALTNGKSLADRQIKYLLKHTADKVSGQIKDIRAGFGNVNLLDALKLLQYKM